MNVVDAGVGRLPAKGINRTGISTRTKPAFLGIDNLVENLAAALRHAGARTIRTVVPDGTVRLVVNQEEMVKAFAALVARGAAVTILGGLVQIEAGEGNESKGCALLSVSVRAGLSAESDPPSKALAALGGIIKKQSGSFRLGRQRGEVQFSLYLPVLPGA
jgi:hypothetical protein